MNSQDEIEKQIIALLKNDDSRAIELIYDRMKDKLYGYAMAMTGSKHDTEDVMQELFIQIAAKKDKCAKADNIFAYIFVMMKNLVTENIRKKQRTRNNLDSFSEYLVIKNEETKICDNDKDALYKALSILPFEQKEVIVMKFFHGMTFEEICSYTGISFGTLSSRYRYGIKRLKGIMGEAQ